MNQTADVIHLTGVAKMLRASTPNTKKKLERMNVKPLQRITMPSGREYLIFDRVKVEQAIARDKDIKAASKPVATAKGNEDIRAELQEVRAMLQQVMEVVTKPRKQAKKQGTRKPLNATKPGPTPAPEPSKEHANA
jgi:hypothetical protein